jgi:hypothetical protein
MLRAVTAWRPEAVALFEEIVPDFSDIAALNPQIVEHRGCILNRRALDNRRLSQWFEDRFGDGQREYVLNRVHLWDIAWMPNEEGPAEEVTARLRAFLPTLAEFWR